MIAQGKATLECTQPLLTHDSGLELNRNIEHLRAFAILMVLCLHFTWLHTALPEILWGAWSGVDLFFAISGFVIAASLSRSLAPSSASDSFLQKLSLNQTAIGSFFVRRFFRIYPPLLATLALAALLTAILAVTRWKSLSVEIVAALSMTYNYVIYRGGPFLMDPLWSLAVEMQFYVLLPFFLLAFSTNGQRLAAAIVVFLVIGAIVRPAHIWALTAISDDDWLGVRFSTHCRLDTLAAGVCVFALSRNRKLMQWLHDLSPLTIRVLAFFCLTILLLVPSATPVEFSHDEGLSLLALAAAGMVLLAVGGKVTLVPPSPVSSLLRYVGERSFSLYLVHRLSAAAFGAVFPDVVSHAYMMDGTGAKFRLVQGIGVTALTLIFAELMYRFVERPSIDAGRRYGNRGNSDEDSNRIRTAAAA